MNYLSTNINNYSQFLPDIDSKYLDNLEKLPSHLQKFFQKSLSQKILQASPYELNKRLDLISTGALGDLTQEEYKKHLESIFSYPNLVDNTNKKEIIPKLATEQTLEKKLSRDKEISSPNVKIIFNYGKRNKQEGVEYSTSVLELTENEEDQINEIIDDMKDKDLINLDSYSEFIESSKNLSESQKIVLLAEIGDLLFDMYHAPDYVCRHIASHLEQLANDIGIKSAAVSGRFFDEGHAYNILKTENGTAIVDYGSILIINSKSIEKALEAYQKNINTITFQHLFFEDNKLKYRLITKDGRNFLNFVGYDETSEKLKNSLLQRDNFANSDLSFELNIEDYLTSAEINCLGFFVKTGEIKGNSSSPIKNMVLSQIGYKRNFLILDTINLNPSLSFIFGDSSKKIKDDADNNLFGVSADLSGNTNNKKGLNLASRIAGNVFGTKESDFFHDLKIEAGLSYKIPLKELNIEPYLIGQLALFPGDLYTYEFVPMLNEIRGGVNLEKNFENNFSFSCNPYLLRRIWKYGAGINFDFSSPNIELNAGVEATKSNYDFCPDTLNLSAGISVPVGNIKINFDYGNKIDNYDGDLTQEPSFTIGGNLNF